MSGCFEIGRLFKCFKYFPTRKDVNTENQTIESIKECIFYAHNETQLSWSDYIGQIETNLKVHIRTSYENTVLWKIAINRSL